MPKVKIFRPRRSRIALVDVKRFAGITPNKIRSLLGALPPGSLDIFQPRNAGKYAGIPHGLSVL
jgi:hypothetical protein